MFLIPTIPKITKVTEACLMNPQEEKKERKLSREEKSTKDMRLLSYNEIILPSSQYQTPSRDRQPHLSTNLASL